MKHSKPRLLRPSASFQCQRMAGRSKAHSRKKNVRFNDKEPEENGKAGVERSSQEGELCRINVGS
jgi:hypothetical protein